MRYWAEDYFRIADHPEIMAEVSELPTSMISLCQVGRGFPVALRRAPGCFPERVHHFAVVPLGAVPARNAEPDIHSLYRAVEAITED
jgi:hypothetical protein